MDGIYKLKLIPGDLSIEETVLQIADTLDNLNGIVDDVFTRITNRINDNIERTTNLQKRIDLSQEKVEKLTGMEKAINVFSSAKYPTCIKHEHYQSVLDLDCYSHRPHPINLSMKTRRPPDNKELQDRLHFYHVKVGIPNSEYSKSDNNLKDKLKSVTSIGELLIFNTDECPYYAAANKMTKRQSTIVENKPRETLEAAPSSIVNKDQVMKRDAEEYMYTPGMGMVPELEMPLDLPHLPGIAGDIQYSIVGDYNIAPSAVTSPTTAVESLPEIEAALPDLKLEDAVAEAKDLTDRPVAVDLPPPPPPPPPPPFVPPPPPPPAPADLPSKVARADAPRASAPVAAAAPVDARSNLMAAIRQAGGAGKAKLRSATTSAADKDDASSAASGGGLMADLHAKLSMRRRGISGAEASRATGGTLLHTLANVIPEPAESSPQHSSTDDDWD